MLVVASVSIDAPRLLKGQTPDVHYRHRGDMPPGAIGRWQLQRGGPLLGYFQPVEIKAPPGAKISLAEGAQSAPRESGSVLMRFLIGPVYRLRVTHIPFHPGGEVYPTVELIDRLYPPPRQARRFPIRIQIAQDDLELALDGKFVVRVIYLEDPRQALPLAGDHEGPDWFDVEPGEDPLQTADALGRPVAILRLGGRLPLPQDGFGMSLESDAPPMLVFSRLQSNHLLKSNEQSDQPVAVGGTAARTSGRNHAEVEENE